MASRLKGVILSIYSAILWSHLEYHSQVLGPPAQEIYGPFRVDPEESHGDNLRTGPPLLSTESKELGLISLKKAQGRPHNILEYLMASYRKEGEGLVIKECSDRTRSKLNKKRVNLG